MLAVLHLIGLTTLENYINDFKGTHRLEVNKFINSTYRPGFKSSITEFCNDVDENFGMFNMPNEFDWRSKGVITPVKNPIRNFRSVDICLPFFVVGFIKNGLSVG